MKNFIKKNWFWAIPALLLILWVLYEIFRKKGSEKTGSDPNTIDPSLRKDVTLYNGIQGYTPEVKALQKILNTKYQANPALVVDGVFGQKTADALHKAKNVWDIKLSAL